MAKLEGVIYLDNGEAVKWGGAVYGRVAAVPEPGDIAFDGADYFEVIPDRSGVREDDAYDRVSILREYGEAFVRKSFVILRKCADNTADYLATKRAQLATITAEIAQLEAQLAEESRLKVGDYARVTDITSVDDFIEGDIVWITSIDDSRPRYSLYGERPIGGDFEYFAPASLTKITPAEAQAALIAQVNAHFNPEGGAESRE